MKIKRLTNSNNATFKPDSKLSSIRTKLVIVENFEEYVGLPIYKFIDNYHQLMALKGRNLRMSIEDLSIYLGKEIDE